MSDPTFIIVGDDGIPRGAIDLDQIQANATLLMYELAAVAGDDAAVDRVCADWVARLDSDAMGYVSAGAVSAMTKHILGPLLEVLDVLSPEFDYRGKLAEARDFTARMTGRGGS